MTTRRGAAPTRCAGQRWARARARACSCKSLVDCRTLLAEVLALGPRSGRCRLSRSARPTPCRRRRGRAAPRAGARLARALVAGRGFWRLTCAGVIRLSVFECAAYLAPGAEGRGVCFPLSQTIERGRAGPTGRACSFYVARASVVSLSPAGFAAAQLLYGVLCHTLRRDDREPPEGGPSPRADQKAVSPTRPFAGPVYGIYPMSSSCQRMCWSGRGIAQQHVLKQPTP